MAIYKQFEVVVVPFPFIDSSKTKRRPALILSNHTEFSVDKSILAMITTKNHRPWSLDTQIKDLNSTGLKTPSILKRSVVLVQKIRQLFNRESEKFLVYKSKPAMPIVSESRFIDYC